MFNIASLLKNAGKIEGLANEAKKELANTQIEGESGAGMVQVTITGDNRAIKLAIDDALLQEPKTIVEELILAAFNSAMQKGAALTKEKMFNMSNMFNMNASNDDEKNQS